MVHEMSFSRLLILALALSLASAVCEFDCPAEDVVNLVQVSTKVDHVKHGTQVSSKKSWTGASQPVFGHILAAQRSKLEMQRSNDAGKSGAKTGGDPHTSSSFGFFILGALATVLSIYWCAKSSFNSRSRTIDAKAKQSGSSAPSRQSSSGNNSGSDEPTEGSADSGLMDHLQQSQSIWQSSFLFSPGWPQFWMMVLFGGFSEALANFVAPDVAYKQLNHGFDPCKHGTSHYSASTCHDVTETFIAGLLTACVVGTFLSLVCAPVVARMCDKHGRKPFIMARAVLTMIHSTTLLLIWFDGLSINWFFITSALLGLVPTLAIWNLYVADRVEPHERTAFFAVLAWCSNADSLAVPVSLLVGSRSTCVWMAFAACLGSLFFAFLLPETLSAERRREMESDSGSYSDSFWLLASDRKVQTFSFLVFVGAVSSFGWCAVRFPWMKMRFGVTARNIAPFRIVQAISNLVVAMWFTKPLTDYLGLRSVMFLSWFAAIAMDACYMAAPSLQYLYLQAPIESAASLCCAAINACFISIAPPSKVAQVQAMFTQVISLAVGIGPVVYAGIMAWAMEDQDNVLLSSNSPLLFDQMLCLVGVVVLVAIPASAFPKHNESSSSLIEN
jgi:MFS family permease